MGPQGNDLFNLDPKILGQLSAATNFINILNTNKKIIEFTSGILKKIPGISNTIICIKGENNSDTQTGENFCELCETDFKNSERKYNNTCVVKEDNGFLSIPLETTSCFFGYIFIDPENISLLKSYISFIRNFANQISIILENRTQHELLKKNEVALLQRKEELEKLVYERTRGLIESEGKFRKAFQSAPLLLTITSIRDGKFIDVNDAFVESTGYTRETAIGSTSVEIGYVQKDERDRMIDILNSQGSVHNLEVTINHADGFQLVCLYSGEIIEYGGKRVLLSTAIDITENKAREEEVIKKSIEIENKNKKLEEMNTALKVLIEHRKKENQEKKNNIIREFEKLVFPYFPSPNEAQTKEKLSTVISILEQNIRDILFRDGNNIGLYANLTPMEMRVAFMIKTGKSSKEIANILNISVRSVSFHRENIRKKLNLTQKKINLKTYLSSQNL